MSESPKCLSDGSKSDSDAQAQPEVIDLDEYDTVSESHDGSAAESDDLILTTKPAVEYNQLRAMACPICLYPPKVLCVTPCGHIYCGESIYTALSSGVRATQMKGECSICRKKVAYNSIVYLEARIGQVEVESEKDSEEDSESEEEQPLQDGNDVKVEKRRRLDPLTR